MKYSLYFRRRNKCVEKFFQNEIALHSYITRFIGDIKDYRFDFQGENFKRYILEIEVHNDNYDVDFLFASVYVM